MTILSKIRYVALSAFFALAERSGLFNLFEKYYFSTARTGRSKTGTLPTIVRQRVDESYLLLAPFNTGDYKKNTGTVYFTDLYGHILNTWHTKYQSSNAQFTQDGDLYVALVMPDSKDTSHFPGGGRTGVVQKLNWQGEVLWEYEQAGMHHDFTVLPSGNLVSIRWEKVRPELAEKVVARVTPPRFETEVWSDVVFEVDERGDVVWEWHAQDHLNPMTDMFGDFPYRAEWTHTNAVQYTARNPIDGTEAFLLSMRNTNRLLIVRKSDGAIIWRSPEDMFMGQHDPKFLENGNILAFDNGLHRKPTSRSEAVVSRVVEVNPRTNEIVWVLEGGTTSSERARLYSSLMCGAQRLKNGNTHVTISSPGHLFEVTPDKQLVWDFVNPHLTHGGGELWPNNSLFNSWRYHKDDVNWPVSLPEPLPKHPAYARIARNALRAEGVV